MHTFAVEFYSGVGRCFQLGGGARVALWCLSDQSSSILVGIGGRLPRGKNKNKNNFASF